MKMTMSAQPIITVGTLVKRRPSALVMQVVAINGDIALCRPVTAKPRDKAIVVPLVELVRARRRPIRVVFA